MATKKKATKRKIYVTDAHSPKGATEADVYWSRGGLAVTRRPGLSWAITVVSCGFAAGPSRWDNPKEAVKVAKALLPVTNWRTNAFDYYYRHRDTIQRKMARALRKVVVAP